MATDMHGVGAQYGNALVYQPLASQWEQASLVCIAVNGHS